VHSFAYARSLRNMPAMTPEEAAKVPPIAHPLVRRHPVTGRKSLYISMCYMTEVIGLGEAESRVLFRELEAFATQDRFIYKHRWASHDILMWDNRCTMKHRRVMHRTSIAGDSMVIAA
jgi:taurine dioxygenase